MNKTNFRHDINGLRAIAVLGVLLFHYDNSLLPGGFVGVDIFFVISGYLMTKIILTAIKNNDFSFTKFYLARARRIIPALLIVVAVLLTISWFILEPMSYQILGKHARDSLLFISNVRYLKESGYFDSDAYEKFLLNTWSLSVEWQFYIFYPIILFLTKKFIGFDRTKRIILIVLLVSLLSCLYLSKTNPEKNYFILYTRAWELLFGALAFLYPLNIKNKKPLFYTSILIIFLSYFYIDKYTLWPGMYTLLPVASTYALIALNNDNGLNNPLLQKIGLWSYSIYLVHWPLLVILKTLEIKQPIYIYLSETIVLSIILYYSIENKRNHRYGLLCSYLFILACCYAVVHNGFESRVDNPYRLSKEEFRDRYEGHMGLPQSKDVQYINSNVNDFDYILIGDSHARHYFSFLTDKKIKVASFALDGCTSTKNYYSSYNARICKERYNQEIDFIKKSNKPIIISRFWPGYNEKTIKRSDNSMIGKTDFNQIMLTELDLIIKETALNDRNYFIIGNTQGTSYNIYECLSRSNLSINNLIPIYHCPSYQKRHNSPYNQTLESYSETHKNVHFINPSNALCHHNNCQLIINDQPLYTDTNHLSKIGADKVGSYIFEKINSSGTE
ncbi:acyltransferase family protein [Xenorhabdus bovienii]|uniref:acyltransferase family protein n=1 Tax=Xenorhabdus bovienii TaxID=40576 RepID=UPI0023B2DDCC|nr:acyltransferase family protein [Xenorhabdus bovienii]MDE9552543.1 acyltransferase [Xenorhabdus bovienii]